MQRHHTAGDRALGDGSTPFMRAAKSGDVAVMRLLVAAGADPLLKQPNQANALMLAAGLGWRDGSPAAPSYDQGSEQDAIEAIKFCMQAGIDINATTNTGETALHAAISGRGSETIVRFLVENGANLTAKNKQGRTPLEVAVASRRDLGGHRLVPEAEDERQLISQSAGFSLRRATWSLLAKRSFSRIVIASAGPALAQPAAECPGPAGPEGPALPGCAPIVTATNPLHTQLWRDAAAIHQIKIAFVDALQRLVPRAGRHVR